MKKAAAGLGTGDIRKLLLRQAIPASVGILFMTVNLLVDTILVGQWIGPIAIATVSVVTPIAFFIGSLGFAIGAGGGSVLSRALGSGHPTKARKTFAHQILLTVCLSFIPVVLGFVFTDEMLALFGAKGKLLEPSRQFLYPILLAAPFQAFCGMANAVIRAEDKSRFSMIALIIPSIVNLALDVIFIKCFGWGIFGAALATGLSFFMAFLFVLWFFVFRSEIKLSRSDFRPETKLVSEIGALSFTTFARQGVISVLSILLNHTLFEEGGENAVAVYGIISKMLMFALFPVNGMVEGFLPVAGFNYGAKKYDRVRLAIRTSVIWGVGFAVVMYVVILIFAAPITTVFTGDDAIAEMTPDALRWVFAASPVIAIQLIGAGYFQAAGNATKALLLTLCKQGFFLIPLILILPDYFGIFGVWISFPIADVLATLVTGGFLLREYKVRLVS